MENISNKAQKTTLPQPDEWSLNDFIELSAGWFWHTDRQLRVCWLSENFQALHGVAREHCYQQPLAVVAGVDSNSQPWIEISSAVAARRRFSDIDVPRPLTNGMRWYRISGFPLFDEDKVLQGYRGVCRDITERRYKQEQSERTRERFMKALDWFEGSFAYYDAERRLVDCNPRYKAITEAMGLSSMLQPGMLYDDLVWAQIQGGHLKGMQGREQEAFCERMEKFQQAVSFEFQLQDGSWHQAIDQRLPDGGTLALRIDITELRRSQQQASILQQRLADAIELFDGGVALYDAEERLVLCNGLYRKNLARYGLIVKPGVCYEQLLRGVVENENRGEDWFRMRLQRFRSAADALEILTADSRWILAKDHRLPDGSTLSVRLHITHIKQIEADLRAAKQQAERANELKTRFLAGASHDLRQPLQAMDFLIQLLDEQPEPAMLAQISTELRQTMTTMEELVRNYLDASRLERGDIEPRFDVFPVIRLLDKIRADFARAATSKNLILRVLPCSALIVSDPILLERILGNLVANALRYTSQGRIVVGCRRQGDDLLIGVWDTGIGIAEDKIDTIFEELYQICSAHEHKGQGVGLGLAIVKQFSRLLKHPLVVHSTLGRGSFFGVKVPRQ